MCYTHLLSPIETGMLHAMAKVLMVGSRKVHDPGEFQSGCRAIGAALAHAGHTIVAPVAEMMTQRLG